MGGNLAVINDRGIAYEVNGVEIGSIVIRPEHIAFIAGNWCRQISRKAKQSEIMELARQQNKRMSKLVGGKG